MASTSNPAASGSGASASFADDPRVHYNQVSSKWEFEADDGKEYEWDVARNSWVPLVDETLLAAQQAAYKVEGVDESTPAAPVLAREKKRKKGADDNGEGPSSKRKDKGPVQKRNTAVYITRLPLDAEPDDLYPVFSKAGLILEDEQGKPRIKIYKDAEGRPKGEALVVYLKEDSVELAIRLFDDTELRLGEGGDTMKVVKAEFTPKQPSEQTQDQNGRPDQGKKRRQKKVDKLKSKLEGWDSDEEAAPTKNRFDKIVVLKHMFSRKELEEDPALLLDLKEDVREEAESLGEVTNVTLYDLEEDGVMTVRFKEEVSAQACVAKMNGRFFAGRQVKALLHDGARYRKTIGNEEDGGTERETWGKYLGTESAPASAPTAGASNGSGSAA